MTGIIIPAGDKRTTVPRLLDTLSVLLFPKLTHNQAAAVTEHMQSLLADNRDLQVRCQFETIPETQTTRIVIDATLVTGPGNPQR